ncbi:hypothetical protein METBIDRAFT_41834, partial [Metschnikowia bicuspidata var. bicuspidata NRRL YB-4993]
RVVRTKTSTNKKKIAAPQFRIWSPTTLLSVALYSLTNVDRTGNSASCMVWPQPKDWMLSKIYRVT